MRARSPINVTLLAVGIWLTSPLWPNGTTCCLPSTLTFDVFSNLLERLVMLLLLILAIVVARLMTAIIRGR
jgi:hypothetical protein